MKVSQNTEETLINSIIGAGTKFKGEFDLNGLLRVDGDFSGIIRTKGKVLIGSNGRVECTMYAGTVVVGGIVRGDIYSTEKVTILSTGMVLGNIQTPRLIIEEGVIFSGKCRISKQIPKEEDNNNNHQMNTINSFLQEKSNENKIEEQISNKNSGYSPPSQNETVVSL